jgi:hypothetical protein
MTLPLETADNTNEDPNYTQAKNLVSRLRGSYQMLKLAQAGLVADNYGHIVNLPNHNKVLQDLITSVQASGQASTIIDFIGSHSLLPSSVTATTIQNYATALDAFASDVESNIGLFVLSLNPSDKRPEFVTPIAQGVKDTISSRIAAVIAEVS